MMRNNIIQAKKTTADGITFDSKKEADRYLVLKKMESEGIISDLILQPEYLLLPKQVDANGRCLERSLSYRADFSYTKDGETIVEDVKGFKFPEYRIKRKLMLYFHGIQIYET